MGMAAILFNSAKPFIKLLVPLRQVSCEFCGNWHTVSKKTFNDLKDFIHVQTQGQQQIPKGTEKI